jgi:hypothetical protein
MSAVACPASGRRPRRNPSAARLEVRHRHQTFRRHQLHQLRAQSHTRGHQRNSVILRLHVFLSHSMESRSLVIGSFGGSQKFAATRLQILERVRCVVLHGGILQCDETMRRDNSRWTTRPSLTVYPPSRVSCQTRVNNPIQWGLNRLAAPNSVGLVQIISSCKSK